METIIENCYKDYIIEGITFVYRIAVTLSCCVQRINEKNSRHIFGQLVILQSALSHASVPLREQQFYHILI